MSVAPRVEIAWLTANGYWQCPACGRWTNGAGHCGQPKAQPQAETRPEAPKPQKARKREPSKTEARYWREVLQSCGHYELLTFHLANGHAYTPDFVVWTGNNVLECHEVKGSYRLGSYQRARLAFDQARTELPWFRWVWAELTKDGWRTT